MKVIDDDKEKLDQVEIILKSQRNKFKKKRPCVYFWTIIGLGLGTLFALFSIFQYKSLNFAIYNRKGLDDLTKKYLGYTTWDKLLVKSLFTPSFDYNSKTPRFYGEYFKKEDPGRYNATLNQAIAASASSPVAFDPLTLYNGFGIREELIDGGLICNSPSLYAF